MAYTMILDSEHGLRLDNSSVRFNITERILATRKLTSIRVKEVFIKNQFWNITANFNNTLGVTFIGTADLNRYTITIPPGYYTGTDLITEINALFIISLAATAHTLTFSFNTVDFLVTLTGTSPGAVPVAFLIDAVAATVIDQTPHIFHLLGFFDTSLNSGPGGILISPYPLNSTPNRYMFVHCDNCKGQSIPYDLLDFKSWKDGAIAIIPLIGNNGDNIHYIPKSSQFHTMFAIPIPISTAAVPVELGARSLEIKFSSSMYEFFGSVGTGPNVAWTLVIELN